MSAVTQNTPTEINFLADAENKGFSVYFNSEERVFDSIGIVSGMTGKNRRMSAKILKNIQGDHSRMYQKMILSKFTGLRKKTLACDVDTAIELVMVLPGKTAAQFREQCAQTIRRVLAGDETLVAEIRENAQRTDDVTQLMQAETRQERDEEWYDTREIHQKAAHHDRVKAMKLRFPAAGSWQHIDWNVKISEAVTGMKPKQFSEVTGAPAKNRRDFYSSEQLHTVAIMDLRAKKMFEAREKLPTWKSVQEEFATLADSTTNFSKDVGIHGSELSTPPERPVLTFKKALQRTITN
jgi:hypothetical protein